MQLAAGSGESQPIPGAIIDLIASRIDQLSLPQQLALKTASVIGRTFRHQVVREIFPVERDRPQLDGTLRSLQSAELISPTPTEPLTSSLFKHVLIHEVAYQQLPRAQRRALHRMAADWFVAVHGDDPATAPLLAHHFGEADEPAQEIHFLTLAGHEALRANANAEAAGFFAAAISRHEQLCGASPATDQRIRRGGLLRQLGEANFGLGKLTAARGHLEQALPWLGYPISGAGWRLVASTAGHLLVQAWRLATSRAYRRPPPASTAAATANAAGSPAADPRQDAALVLERLSQIHYFSNEILIGSNRALRTLNMAESAHDSPGLARSYASMCVVMGLVRLHPLARHYGLLARTMAERTGHQPSLTYSLAISCMYYLGVGNWDVVARTAPICVATSERLGDLGRLAEAVCVQAMLACFLARFAESAAHYQRICELGERSGSKLHVAWGLNGLGECRFRQGQLPAAQALLEKSLALLQGMDNRTEEIRIYGLLAHALARQGRFDEARTQMLAGRKVLERDRHTTCSTLEGFAGIVEAALWAAAAGRDENIAGGLAHLKSYARLFPIGRPRLMRCAGLRAWLQGKRRKAEQLWQRSLTAARKLGLQLEEGLALYELGRHAQPQSRGRNEHLQAALEIFSALGLPYEREQAQAALDGATANGATAGLPSSAENGEGTAGQASSGTQP